MLRTKVKDNVLSCRNCEWFDRHKMYCILYKNPSNTCDKYINPKELLDLELEPGTILKRLKSEEEANSIKGRMIKWYNILLIIILLPCSLEYFIVDGMPSHYAPTIISFFTWFRGVYYNFFMQLYEFVKYIWISLCDIL